MTEFFPLHLFHFRTIYTRYCFPSPLLASLNTYNPTSAPFYHFFLTFAAF